MGFLSPGGILDAFSIQGKYSVCAHFKTDRSWAQNYLPGDFEMAYRKYGRTWGAFSNSRLLWVFFYPKSNPFYPNRFAFQSHCNEDRFFACGR
jgi:hypothetical protein